jgi:hypothetical protein
MGRMPSDHNPAGGISRITAISEPAVAPDTPRELLPDNFADRRRFLCFLFFVLQAS